MITSVQALAAAAQKVPAYCHNGTGVRTPAQWQTCVKLGVTSGFPVGLAAIAAVVVLILVFRVLARSGHGAAVPSTR